MTTPPDQKKQAVGHTPTPWTIDAYDSCDKQIYIPQPGVSVCYDDCDHEEQAANAAFIVRACNSHEALLRELKSMYDFIIDCDYSDEESDGMISAKAAIAAAEAE